MSHNSQGKGPHAKETIELRQALIRNACLNEGTEVERSHAAPGRTSLVARIIGTDPDAPSLCLNGHTDVVPVSADGWDEDPFGCELINGEIWGRDAVDMLNLTASMTVATRTISRRTTRLRGDLVFFAVADEEAGSTYGASWMGENHPDAFTLAPT